MILTEYLENNTLVRHYSDQGFLLLQNETGLKYTDPVDIFPCPYTYTETDEIEGEDEPLTGEEFIAMIEAIL